MSNFALIGAAGYIAPRHMKAVKDNGGDIKVAVDRHDSVGILDSYFPNASFFTEMERFDRHVYKLKKTKDKINYFSICTPNYLHDAHIRLALRNDADAICEKPLVINPKNIKHLKSLEDDTGRKIHAILQLRYHDVIKEMKNYYSDYKGIADIKLKYITPRGKWYHHSWKGDSEKSGGLPSNIGVHFFDMLTWVFGPPKRNIVFDVNKTSCNGFLRLEKANVEWFLSVNPLDLPNYNDREHNSPYRSMTVDGNNFDFSVGFEDLHTLTYSNILNGNSFGVNDVSIAIEIAKDVLVGSGVYIY